MAITYPRTPPATPAPLAVEWGPLSVVGVNSSPLTLGAEKFRFAGRRLDVAVAYPSMTRATGDPWAAFLASLDGPFGTFLFGPQGDGATPKGAATGTPLVNGANQVGSSLVTDGWSFTITGILKAGDWIQLGTGALSRLHIILQDANSDGAGNATFDIWPQLRESPADNSAIVVASPKGVFRLKSRPQWAIGLAYRYEPLSFEAEEDF